MEMFMIIYSIFLAIYLARIFIKDFFIHYNLSENGFKNVLYAVFIVAGLFCSMVMYKASDNVDDLKAMKEAINLSQSISDEQKDEENDWIYKEVEFYKNECKKATIYSFIDLGLILIIRKNIKREHKDFKNKHRKRWSDKKVEKL